MKSAKDPVSRRPPSVEQMFPPQKGWHTVGSLNHEENGACTDRELRSRMLKHENGMLNAGIEVRWVVDPLTPSQKCVVSHMQMYGTATDAAVIAYDIQHPILE